MKLIYKFLVTVIFITYIFLLFFSYDSFASESLNIAKESINIDSEACILMDADFGKILYEKNSKERLYPASTTKVMTAILTVENCNLQDKVTVSYWAINSVPATYSMGHISVGQELTVEQLLNITMIASANDAAYVLAEYIANLNNRDYLKDSSEEAKTSFDTSIATFAEMMNKKAKDIGCLDTNFLNPNGIHNDNHYSTAYDLALIGKYAYSNSIINSIVSKETYNFPENSVNNYTEYKSTNALLRHDSKYYYEFANGLKTGYTDPAGYCIIATAKKDNMNLLAVILKGRHLENGTSSRENDCLNLFNYGFNNFTSTQLINNGDVARTINIINGTEDSKSLDLICTNNLNCLVETDEIIDVTPSLNLTNVLAPISKGEVIGTITYTVDEIEYSCDLIASHDVYSSDTKNFILLLSVVFVILLIAFLIIFKPKKTKNK